MKSKTLMTVLSVFMLFMLSITEAVADSGNDWQDANQISLSSKHSESIGKVIGTDDNGYDIIDVQDWFKITIPKYGLVNATISAKGFAVKMNFYPDKGEVPSSGKIMSTTVRDYQANSNEKTVSKHLMPGTYYIQIEEYDSSSYRGPIEGIYTLSVSQIQEQQPDDTDEKDNEFKEARIIKLDQTYTGNILYKNSKGDWDYEDWFKVNIPQYGLVNATISAKGFAVKMNFYPDKGKVPSSGKIMSTTARDYQANSNEKTVSKYLMPGTYYIQIEDYDSSSYPIEGVYTLSVSQVQEQQPDDTDEKDNEFKEARIIKLNQTYTGNILYKNSKGDWDYEDWFKVNIPQYGLVNATITAKGFAVKMNFYPDKGEVPSSGKIMSTSARDYQANSNEKTVSKHLMPGTYYIQIEDYDSSSYPREGIYTLSVNQVQEQQPDDTDEDDNEFKNSRTLTFNNEYTGNIYYRDSTNKTDDVDWFKITMSQDDDINFRLNATGFKTELNIYRDKGANSSASRIKTIYATDYQATSNVASVVQKLTAGTYYLELNGSEYHDSGIYKLLINPASDATTNNPPTVGTYQEGRQSCISEPATCQLYDADDLNAAKKEAKKECADNPESCGVDVAVINKKCSEDPKSCGINCAENPESCGVDVAAIKKKCSEDPNSCGINLPSFDGVALTIPMIKSGNDIYHNIKMDKMIADPIQFVLTDLADKNKNIIFDKKLPIMDDYNYRCDSSNSILNDESGYISFKRQQQGNFVVEYQITIDTIGTHVLSPYIGVLYNEIESIIPSNPELEIKQIGKSNFEAPSYEVAREVSAVVTGMQLALGFINIPYSIAILGGVADAIGKTVDVFKDLEIELQKDIEKKLRNKDNYDAYMIFENEARSGWFKRKHDQVRFTFKITEKYSRPVLYLGWAKHETLGINDSSFVEFYAGMNPPVVIINTTANKQKGSYCKL